MAKQMEIEKQTEVKQVVARLIGRLLEKGDSVQRIKELIENEKLN